MLVVAFGTHLNQSLITSHVISHEMGHVLFLWHTHHGTGEGGNDNPCPELVDGSNSSICGDYVTDTPADPHIQFNVNSSCQWLGSGTDANGDSYNPDEHNIMAYTTPQCMSYFTSLQGLRARNAIASLSYLQQTLATKCSSGDVLDLYVKDDPADNGTEPNPTTQDMWRSKDIWVRNNDDNGLTHQNPEYRTNGNPNYIYVRVINKSCETSLGSETLTLNWAKANTALAWPQNWDGSLQNSNGYDLGGALPSVTIPVIQPGGETIVKIPWVVPNPNNYLDNGNPWHFCLIARIDSSLDPMGTYTTNPNIMVRNNNNQAWKNITVVDLTADFGIGGVVGIGNLYDEPRTHKLTFKLDEVSNNSLFDEAEVSVELDDNLLDIWLSNGQQGDNIRFDPKRNKIFILNNNATLENLTLKPDDYHTLYLSFNFLTEKITDKTSYIYHVIQNEQNTNEIIGGETYIIKKEDRELFFANAGSNKKVDANETVTLSSNDINEPATYNWYDKDGNLLYQGKDFTVTVDSLQKYKLEIIALSDGYKDYDDVKVKLLPNRIESINPNPSTNNILVNYKINKANSAYISITNINNPNISCNYILDINKTYIDVDISSLPQGIYAVTLIYDGNVANTIKLIKQ